MSDLLTPQVFSLRSIYIRQSRIRMNDDFDPAIPGQLLAAQFRTDSNFRVLGRETRPEGSAPLKSAIFLLGFEFRYLLSPQLSQEKPAPVGEADPGSEDEGVASITAQVALDYLINGDVMPSEEEMQRWGNTTAIVHAWPYWREYCHSSVVRMNLPVTLMPMLNIAAVQRAGEELSASKAHKSTSRKKAKRSKGK